YPRFLRQRRQRRIVLDVRYRFLVLQRNLHARIEDVSRIESLFDEAERLDRVLVPDPSEQRCADPSVTVFAGQRPAESSSESDDIIEETGDALPPVGLGHVDQRIDVDVGIAGVAEDHTANLARGERFSDSLDVIRKLRERHCAVLDELHRSRVLEAGENRTGSVAKLPDLAL